MRASEFRFQIYLFKPVPSSPQIMIGNVLLMPWMYCADSGKLARNLRPTNYNSDHTVSSSLNFNAKACAPVKLHGQSFTLQSLPQVPNLRMYLACLGAEQKRRSGLFACSARAIVSGLRTEIFSVIGVGSCLLFFMGSSTSSVATNADRFIHRENPRARDPACV